MKIDKIMIIILGVLIALWLIYELTIILMYSGFISKNDYNFYSNLTEFRLNIYNDDIISVYNQNKRITFISRIKISILFKYYINGIGVVPINTKLHKKINEYYKIAKKI